MPGRTPWASASPTKLMPRMTTQVPTGAAMATTSSPATSARCMNSNPNGSVSHVIAVLSCGVRRRAGRPPLRSRQGLGDAVGVGEDQPEVGVGLGPLLAEGLGVQLHDLDVAHLVGERVGQLVGR